MVQPTPRVKRIVEYKGSDVVALTNQFLSKARTYESISACDENFIHLELTPLVRKLFFFNLLPASIQLNSLGLA